MADVKRDDLLFQFYLVVFLDHLGQRKGLRKITGIPTNRDDAEKFITQMRDSMGKVLKLRRWFKDFFESANAYKPNLNLVPNELQQEFASSQKSEACFYGFSDSIIIAVPLMSNDENCTAINGVFSAFAATCGLGLLSLSAEIVTRGGLDVGVATKIEGNEIYGPGLERAYFIESQLSEYPRYVLGDELIQYIYWVENQTCSSRLGVVAKEIAKYCKAMIIRDADGRYMLDFLGEKAKELADKSIDATIVKNAYDFVKQQHEYYSKSQDHILASRYYRLMSYFKHKLPIWGI